jgi:hypothetical protein
MTLSDDTELRSETRYPVIDPHASPITNRPLAMLVTYGIGQMVGTPI